MTSCTIWRRSFHNSSSACPSGHAIIFRPLLIVEWIKKVLFSARLCISVAVSLAAIAHAAGAAELGNLDLTREQVRTAQGTLAELGYEAGPADGLMGRNTRQAYRDFLEESGFADDGELGEADVALLRAVAYNTDNAHGLSGLALPDDWELNLSAQVALAERDMLRTGYERRYTEERGVLWRENCEEVLANIYDSAVAIDRGEFDDRGGPVSIQGCIEGLGNIVAHTDDFSPLARILSGWSENTYIEYPADAFNGFYEVISAVTIFGSHYAVFYDEYPLEDEERARIDAFLASAVQVDISQTRDSMEPPPLPCGPETLDRLGYLPEHGSWVDNDTCGSLRWKLTIAQVALALRLSDERLWELARYNTQFMLNMFDEDNLFVTWAVASGLAINYSKNVPMMLGVLTELYQGAGYDFLTHENRHGSSVADMFETYWAFMTDGPRLRNTPMHEYASRPLRESQATVEEVEDESMTELFRRNDTHPYTFLRWSKRYAMRHDPDLLKHDSGSFQPGLDGSENNIINSFGILDVELMRVANDGS